MSAPRAKRTRDAAGTDEDEELDGDDGARIGMLPPSTLDATLKLFVTHTEPNYSLPCVSEPRFTFLELASPSLSSCADADLYRADRRLL